MPGALSSGGGFSFGTLANRPAANVGISLYLATDNGVLYWSDGAAWHQSGTNDIPVVMPSGNYVMPVSQGASTTLSLAGGTMRHTQLVVPHDLTLSRIGGEVTTIGDVGSTIRLTIYADNGGMYPGALVLDAGVIAGDSATVQEIVINQPLSAGLYHLGAATQGAPVTSPIMRGISSTPAPIPFPSPTIPGANALWAAYSLAGQAGAAPNPYPAGAVLAANAPRLFVKVA